MILQSWRDYIRFYRGNLHIVPLAVGSALAQALLLVPVAFLVRDLFDHVLPAHRSGMLAVVGAALLCLYVLNGGLAVLTRYLALRVTKAAVLRLRGALLHKVYTLPRPYYDQADLGQLQATLVQDSERVDIMSNALLLLLLPAAVVTLALGAVLLYLDPILFLTLLVVMPPLIIVSRTVGARVRDRVRLYHDAFRTFSSGILFVLQVMDLTRIQTGEQGEIERQTRYMNDLRDRSTAMAWTQAAYIQ